MPKFYLKNIKRIMFVVIDKKLFLSPSSLNISHGDWFREEGWMNNRDNSFMEENPRGYVDKEGVYIYQGRNARVPVMAEEMLAEIIKNLYEKLNIDNKLHVFIGTLNMPENKKGKLPPRVDLGTISNILKI